MRLIDYGNLWSPASGKQQPGGISASLAANRPNNNGLFADLFSSQPSPKKLTVPQKDLLVFFRQLAVILQSGVPLAQGLLLIAENMTNQRLANCVQHIAARLSAGEELSLSLKQYPKVFEPLTVGLIEAGEAGGILEQVLDRVALLLEDGQDPRTNYRSNGLSGNRSDSGNHS